MMRPVGFIACFLLLLTFHADATVFVSKTGDNTDGTSWETAFQTINKALIAAEAGESIWVEEGAYTEGLMLERPVSLFGGFRGNETSIDQLQNLDLRHRSEILGGSNYAVVTILGTVAYIEGLRIRPGTLKEARGIDVENASITIRYTNVDSNHSTINGGGIGIGGSRVRLEHCVIQQNIARGHGGGIDSFRSTVTITNCLIQNNEAIDILEPFYNASDGGGIVFSGTMTIQNSIIAHNKATNASEIGGSGAGLLIKNCTVYSEDKEFISFSPQGGPPATFVNCVLWGNTEVFPTLFPVNVSYTNSSQPTDGPGNISEDPLFLNPENGDFHLLPGSPCIDAGTDVGVYSDLDGNPRPIGWYDMGAYEFPYLRGDLNGDNRVDAMDLLLFQEDWMKVTGP